MPWAYLRRGLVAGLLAGLLAGIFAYLFAEPVLERAIKLESAAHEHGEEVFDRGQQRAGLILATALYGMSVGALFGVGADPATLTERTLAYLATVAIGMLAVLAAWRFARGLEKTSLPVRDLTVGGILAGLWAFLYLAMPEFGVAAGRAPAELVWDFRLSSLGTQLVLWAGIGCIFGLLGERASRRTTL
jgi:predicted cobalt transporter CbtA